MDKIKLVERSFEIVNDAQGTRYLVMYSRTEGEFGTVFCTCSCELNGSLMFAKVVDCAEPDAGYTFRLHEMLYFSQFILPLFNPQNQFKDGLSSFPQPLWQAPSQSQSD